MAAKKRVIPPDVQLVLDDITGTLGLLSELPGQAASFVGNCRKTLTGIMSSVRVNGIVTVEQTRAISNIKGGIQGWRK